jgi:hypothetical protein
MKDKLDFKSSAVVTTTRAIIFPTSPLVFAEFERDLIRRTNAGLAAARARGRKGGRRQGMTKKLRKKKAILAESYYKQEIWRLIRVPPQSPNFITHSQMQKSKMCLYSSKF